MVDANNMNNDIREVVRSDLYSAQRRTRLNYLAGETEKIGSFPHSEPEQSRNAN